MRFSLRQQVIGGFGLALVVIAVIGGASYWSTVEARRTAERVEESHTVIALLDETFSKLNDAEAGTRGYVITGEEEYLERYESAASDVGAGIEELKALTADNRPHQEALDSLGSLTEQRIASAQESITLRRDGGFEAARAYILTGEGRELTLQIRALISRMESQERDVLGTRDNDAEASAQRTEYITLFGSGLVLVIVVAAIVSINRQITERQRAIEELDGFFTLSLDMLSIAGFDGYFKRINPAWEQITGFTTDELLSRPYLDFVHPDDVEATIAEASNLSIQGIDTISFENRYRCKDGSYKWLSWNATPMPNQEHIFAIARDNTERRQAEDLRAQHAAELASSNSQLEDFSYVVSHDLKEPLRAIEAFSSFLAEDYSDKLDEEGQRYIAVLRESSVRMKNLIEDLLELSRVGREKPNFDAVAVGNVLEEVRSDQEFSLAERSATLRIQSDLPTVHCDRLRLKQVFQNLISNAIKYNKQPRPNVEVACREGDGFYVFSVRDNGIGIDERYHEKIFQIFQRLNSRDEYEGTGAGLTICKKIVEAHGGSIWVESAVGEGSTFCFTMPMSMAQAKAA